MQRAFASFMWQLNRLGVGVNRFIAVDPDKCIGCGTCRAACSEGHLEYGLQGEPGLSVIQTSDISAALACHHCEGAPCLQVCPVNAIDHDNGSIHINEQTCIGCKLCGIACPFGCIHPSGTSIAGVAGIMMATPTYSKSLEPLLRWEVGVVTCAVKCDLCSYDPVGGPRCVGACPTNALTYVNGELMQETVKERRLETASEHEVLVDDLHAYRGEE